MSKKPPFFLPLWRWEKIYTFSFFNSIDILFPSYAAILMFYLKVSSLPWTRPVVA